MSDILKYPRTQHIEGSGIQKGDEDLSMVPLSAFAGRFLVVEEKMDGANSAISFDASGRLQLQSRGHYLNGGEREKQFHLLKTWAYRYALELWQTLGTCYIMYGEWLYAKHTIFYTDLPHYFLEFDIRDKISGEFLSTLRRQTLLRALPFVCSVKVLRDGAIESLASLQKLIGPSHFVQRDQKQLLAPLCAQRGLELARTLKETDTSGIMEGLYIKVEEAGIVKARYKYVRGGFLQAVFASESHWLDRPLLPNALSPGCELF
ncbi:MAG TPA: RNA ligase family protein [Ktedonobacteraceae bacterium]|jgi:hypothetical protein